MNIYHKTFDKAILRQEIQRHDTGRLREKERSDIFMTTREWAAKEVELVGNKIDKSDFVWYKSALRAFNKLLDDQHTGTTIAYTKNILNRLIEGKPLSPIRDDDDIWEITFKEKGTETTVYQCTRMPSLFKYVSCDGDATYKDCKRITVYDVGSKSSFYVNWVSDIIHEMYPITLPYMPKDGAYIVMREKHGDLTALLYLLTPDGERVELNRYFTDKDGEFVEISEDEFVEMISEEDELWMRTRKG